MINIQAQKYCSEDISLIENYDKAVNDTTQMWELHHKLGKELNLSKKELKKRNLYFNRPASELIFLTIHEHRMVHGFKHSEETKKLFSKQRKGRKLSEEHKLHLSEHLGKYGHPKGMLGKHLSKETKEKLHEQSKNRCWVNKNGNRKFVKEYDLDIYLQNGWVKGFKIKNDI